MERVSRLANGNAESEREISKMNKHRAMSEGRIESMIEREWLSLLGIA